MFTQTWKKYLPVIVILLKRAANGDQTLSMNHTDFERAAGGKKVKYHFSDLQINKGKVSSLVKHNAAAKDLATLLTEEDASAPLIRAGHYEFSMSSGFILQIRNHAATPAVVAPGEE
jgi:hypothetical protein